MLVYDCYICGNQCQYGEIKSCEIFNHLDYEPEYEVVVCPECAFAIKCSIDNLKNERSNNERSDS